MVSVKEAKRVKHCIHISSQQEMSATSIKCSLKYHQVLINIWYFVVV